jgi:hypothetical protein
MGFNSGVKGLNTFVTMSVADLRKILVFRENDRGADVCSRRPNVGSGIASAEC